MLDVDLYRLYNGFWACDLMPCFCRDFCDFFKSLPCFLSFFAVIFYCPYLSSQKQHKTMTKPTTPLQQQQQQTTGLLFDS